MKRAVILHGTGGNPESNWFPWLKQKLKSHSYDVWAPLLPENHTPNREVYGDFLLGQSWDFTDNVVVGHSSGAVEVLNLLMDERMPHIKLGVMVGAWASNDIDATSAQITAYQQAGLSREQFKNTFPPGGFDFADMKSKADNLAFLHGSDDPYCPLEQAQYLAKQLNASLTVVPNGQHLGANFTELPQLWDIIEPELF